MNEVVINIEIFGLILFCFDILGILCIINVLKSPRSSQAVIAWIIGLFSTSLIVVPLYWLLGRSKFMGYVTARRERHEELQPVIDEATSHGIDQYISPRASETTDHKTFEALAELPMLDHNRVELLIDGHATFDAIFAGIERATSYILVQFYIIKDDGLGGELKKRLIQKASAGVKVFLLYDEIGSSKLSRRYRKDLEDAGVVVNRFNTAARGNRFQVNFRNHRKIVVVDGEVAYVGGHNVGDDYLGLYPALSPWRDVHLSIEGPAVLPVQLVFLEDWYWSTRSIPELNWIPRPVQDTDQSVFVLPSGPADKLETCGLFFVAAINAAKERIWIASPYFIPDEKITAALELAVMRNVDVRVLIPRNADQFWVNRAGHYYADILLQNGIKIYELLPGFMHHKVVLIDDHTATVGTANFDNRSFKLNFEITIGVVDTNLADDVRKMMEHDFTNAQLMQPDDFQKRSFWFQTTAYLSRLLSPIL